MNIIDSDNILWPKESLELKEDSISQTDLQKVVSEGFGYYKLGLKDLKQKKYDSAYTHFKIAAEKYHIPLAMEKLGILCQYSVNKKGEAVDWYQKAIRQFKKEKNWDEVVDCYKKVWVQINIDTVTKDLKLAAKHNVSKAIDFLKSLQQ